MKNKDDERVGTVTLESEGPIVAGSIGRWRFVYTAGRYGIDEGGTIMFVQRTASDWEIPQFDRPDQPGYTTLDTESGARLTTRFERKAYVRPWNLWCLLIDIHDAALAPGDRVHIVLGDRSQGSPGIRAQTFAESRHEFRFLVDPTNASVFRRLNTSPFVQSSQVKQIGSSASFPPR